MFPFTMVIIEERVREDCLYGLEDKNWCSLGDTLPVCRHCVWWVWTDVVTQRWRHPRGLRIESTRRVMNLSFQFGYIEGYERNVWVTILLLITCSGSVVVITVCKIVQANALRSSLIICWFSGFTAPATCIYSTTRAHTRTLQWLSAALSRLAFTSCKLVLNSVSHLSDSKPTGDIC